MNPVHLAEFHQALKDAKRIVAVVGAGLSASSGLAVFRGTDGLWKGQNLQQVASVAGFRYDPGLVWQFHSFRRHEALVARPNDGHYALAELARRVPGFVTLTQNIDNLSPRAGHPSDRLFQLHGNLFNLRCMDDAICGYVEVGNFKDPLTPALNAARDEASAIGRIEAGSIPRASPLLLAGLARKNAQILGDKYEDKEVLAEDLAPLRDITAASLKVETGQQKLPKSKISLHTELTKDDLPQCPKCKNNLLRPAVVWFGESLAQGTIEAAGALFSDDAEPTDLCLVIGTSSQVWPAAGFAAQAQRKGARVATINIDVADAKHVRLGKDWVFEGDAAQLLPELLKPVIGDLESWKISG